MGTLSGKLQQLGLKHFFGIEAEAPVKEQVQGGTLKGDIGAR